MNGSGVESDMWTILIIVSSLWGEGITSVGQYSSLRECLAVRRLVVEAIPVENLHRAPKVTCVPSTDYKHQLKINHNKNKD